MSTATAVKTGPPAKVPQHQNGSASIAAAAAASESTKKSVKVVENLPTSTAVASANGTAPSRKHGTPVRKTANHDPNHAKRSHSPEPRTSSSSSGSGEDSGEGTSTEGSSSSSSTPASAATATPVVPAKPEPPTLKGSGPNGELTLKDIPVSGISFQEVFNPDHVGPPLTKVIIYKPKNGIGQPTAKVIVTKVLSVSVF